MFSLLREWLSVGAGRLTRSEVLCWVLAVAATTLACYQYLHVQGARSLVPDEGIYSFVGWAWVNGESLYRDAWDHKGPVIYAVTALRTALFGNSAALVGVQEVVLGVLAAFAVASTATILWGHVVGALTLFVATVLWSHVGPAVGPDGGTVSTAGSLIAVLTSAAVLIAAAVARVQSTRRFRILLMLFGVTQGLLFAAKPNAIVTLPLVFLAVHFSDKRPPLLRSSLIVVGAAVGVFAAICLAFLVQGSLGAFLDAAYGFNVFRATNAYEVRGISGIVLPFLKFTYGTYTLPIVVAVFLCAVVVGLSLKSRPRDRSELMTAILPVAWVCVELIGIASNGAYPRHMFTFNFALALAAAWVIAEIGNARNAPSHGPLAGAVALALMITQPVVGLVSLERNRNVPNYYRVAEYLRASTAPDERILQFPGWLSASVLFMAERKAANRYMTPIPLHLPGYASEERWKEYADALGGSKPVRTVLADLLGNSQWARPDSLRSMVNQLDAPMTSLRADRREFVERTRAKKLLVDNYQVEFCYQSLCVLRRRPLSD